MAACAPFLLPASLLNEKLQCTPPARPHPPFPPPPCHRQRPAVAANLSARVGSIGDNRLGGWYSYRASKAAVNQLTKCAALEFERRRQRVAAILLHPGTVDTDLSKPFQRVSGGSWTRCCLCSLAPLLGPASTPGRYRGRASQSER